MQVARLMREMGLQGAVRGRRFKTTKPDSSGARPMDLVERDFNATRPNELWVSDLTYVATWRGIVYLWRAFGRNPARLWPPWRTRHQALVLPQGPFLPAPISSASQAATSACSRTSLRRW